MSRRLPFSKPTYGYVHDYRWKIERESSVPDSDAATRDAARGGIKFYHGNLGAVYEAIKTKKAQEARAARERAKAKKIKKTKQSKSARTHADRLARWKAAGRPRKKNSNKSSSKA